ncbi:hypothetical protein [Photobacterium leiognathi]|uniref:hypothetical protein n=1 Tax=Photobacterium leiognathi TaxID=553611 RepID=UPI002980A93F|nr:hypothetical protein [Photobacterium leiognathi]
MNKNILICLVLLFAGNVNANTNSDVDDLVALANSNITSNQQNKSDVNSNYLSNITATQIDVSTLNSSIHNQDGIWSFETKIKTSGLGYLSFALDSDWVIYSDSNDTSRRVKFPSDFNIEVQLIDDQGKIILDNKVSLQNPLYYEVGSSPLAFTLSNGANTTDLKVGKTYTIKIIGNYRYWRYIQTDAINVTGMMLTVVEG